MDLFLRIALEEYTHLLLDGEGKEKDSEYLRKICYERYEKELHV